MLAFRYEVTGKRHIPTPERNGRVGMRFLVDECTGPAVARWLRGKGHDVLFAGESLRGKDDQLILRIASQENRILLTNDKDFGEKVMRDRQPHVGIVLLRLEDESALHKIHIVESLLLGHSEQLPNHFVVVTEKQVRFARSGFPASR